MDPSSNAMWQNLETRLLNALQSYYIPETVPPAAAPRREERQNRNVDNEHEMLNDMIYYYSQNIREYNANIRELIYRVEDYQTSRRSRHSNAHRNRNRFANNYYTNRENPFRMYYHTQWIPTNPLGTQSPAVLTREEIARATLTYGFTEEMILRDASGETTNVCPISLEPLQIGDVICEIRGCRHKFKRPNLMIWLNRNSNCPVCRYNLRTPLEPSSTAEEPLTHEEHEEMEQDEEEQVEDPSGNLTESNIRQIQDSLTQLFQNAFLNADASANLLYEFEFPIYNRNSVFNDMMRNNDIPYNDNEIEHDEQVD
jgi:hypothetical protein